MQAPSPEVVRRRHLRQKKIICGRDVKKNNLWWNNGWMKSGPELYLFFDFSSVDSGVPYLNEAGRGMC
jgi:hypothetical protein